MKSYQIPKNIIWKCPQSICRDEIFIHTGKYLVFCCTFSFDQSAHVLLSGLIKTWPFRTCANRVWLIGTSPHHAGTLWRVHVHHKQLRLVQTLLSYINPQPIRLLTVPKARACPVIFRGQHLEVTTGCCFQSKPILLPSLAAPPLQAPSCRLLGVYLLALFMGMDGGVWEWRDIWWQLPTSF